MGQISDTYWVICLTAKGFEISSAKNMINVPSNYSRGLNKKMALQKPNHEFELLSLKEALLVESEYKPRSLFKKKESLSFRFANNRKITLECECLDYDAFFLNLNLPLDGKVYDDLSKPPTFRENNKHIYNLCYSHLMNALAIKKFTLHLSPESQYTAQQSSLDSLMINAHYVSIEGSLSFKQLGNWGYNHEETVKMLFYPDIVNELMINGETTKQNNYLIHVSS
jgi:hypothetical protein